MRIFLLLIAFYICVNSSSWGTHLRSVALQLEGESDSNDGIANVIVRGIHPGLVPDQGKYKIYVDLDIAAETFASVNDRFACKFEGSSPNTFSTTSSLILGEEEEFQWYCFSPVEVMPQTLNVTLVESNIKRNETMLVSVERGEDKKTREVFLLTVVPSLSLSKIVPSFGSFVYSENESFGPASFTKEHQLYIHGSNFVNTAELSCGFILENESALSASMEIIKSKARFLSTTEIECRAPAVYDHRAAALVQVSNNGRNFEGHESKLRFHYIPPLSISSVVPATIPLAMMDDKQQFKGVPGTMVTVELEPFILPQRSLSSTTSAFVLVQSIESGIFSSKVPGSIIFDTSSNMDTAIGIQSYFPIDFCSKCLNEEDDSMLLSVSVSINDGYEYTTLSPYRTPLLLLHAPLEVYHLLPSPAWLSELGGTNITLIGRHFYPSRALQCHLMPSVDNDKNVKNNEPDHEVVFITAYWQSHNKVSCLLPALRPSKYNVWLSSNGQDSGKVKAPSPLIIHDVITLLSIQPRIGPLQGGTWITMKGTGFPSSSIVGDIRSNEIDARCMFHEIDNTDAPTFQGVSIAKILDGTTVTCRSPSYRGTKNLHIAEPQVTVSLSINGGVTYAALEGVFFTYQQEKSF